MSFRSPPTFLAKKQIRTDDCDRHHYFLSFYGEEALLARLCPEAVSTRVLRYTDGARILLALDSYERILGALLWPSARYETVAGDSWWRYGYPSMDSYSRQPSNMLLGPCPTCGTCTSFYGGGWECHNWNCRHNSGHFCCSNGPAPSWWNTDVQMRRRTDTRTWEASAPGYLSGTGATPQEAVGAMQSLDGYVFPTWADALGAAPTQQADGSWRVALADLEGVGATREEAVASFDKTVAAEVARVV